MAKNESLKTDARILGQILAAQNVLFVLPSEKQISEFYSNLLLSVPGVSSCRICIGELQDKPNDKHCPQCPRHVIGEKIPFIPKEFICKLENLKNHCVLPIETLDRRFGFFVLIIRDFRLFELYQPFISNLANFIGLSLENRLQRVDLQTAHDLLEVRVKERTAELQSANINLQDEIKEHKRTEKALRNSEEQFKFLFDTMAQGLVIQDTEGKILDANRAAGEILGLSMDQLLGKTTSDPRWKLVHEDGTQLTPAEMPSNIVLRTCKSVADVLIGAFIPEKNTYHWIITSSTPKFREGENTPYLTMTTFTDITDRKLAEHALKEQYSTLYGIINSSNSLIFSVDKRYCYTTFNKGHAEVMKVIYGADIEISHSLLDYMTVTSDREIAKHNINRALAGELVIEESFSGEELLSRKYFRVSHNPIKNDRGVIIGVSVFASDITEQKQNEAINASRMHLIQFSLSHTLDELLEETLNETEKLTDSFIGFYHFLEEDQKTLTLQNWSTGTKKEFCKAKGKGQHYGIAEAGVWVDCVYEGKPIIHNNYATLPHRKGMPDGHAEIIRELVVPVFRGKKIVAILGIGNKAIDYTEKDIETVSLLADLAWEIAERKRTEDELKAKTDELDRYFNTALDLLCIADIKGYFRKLNPQWEITLGYSLHELIGKQFLELVHPEDKESTLGAITQLAQQKEVLNFTNRYLAKNNTYKWIEWRSYPVAGKIYAVARDITERKQAELELQKTNELIRAIIESAPTAIINLDLEGKVQNIWNPAAEKMLGWTAQEVIGNYLPSVPIDKETEFNQFRRWIKSGKTLNGIEVKRTRKDGSLINYSLYASPLKDSNGQVFGNVAILVDITERKLAEETLRTSEERYRMAQTISHAGNWEYNLQTNHFWGSDEAKRIYGFDPSRSDFSTEEVENCITERDRVHQALIDLIQENKPYNLEFEVTPKNSSEPRIITSIAELQRDETGNPVRVMGVIQDITNRKRAEEVLKNVARRLNEAQRLAHIGSWELDLISDNLVWTDEIYKIFEIDPMKFGATYESFLKAIHPDDREAVNFAYTESLKTQMPYAIDHRLLFPDGRIKYVHEQCETYYKGDKPVLSIGTVQDITERRLAEEALKESEWRYREIFDNVLDGLYLLEVTKDLRFRTIEVNPALERITGIPRSVSVGKTQEETVPEEVAKTVNAKYRRCIEAGYPIEEEVLLDLPTGRRYFQSTLIPARNDTGKIHRIIGISRDITERREAELKLKLLNFALNNVYDEAYLIDERAFFNYVNDESCRALGYSREELLTMNVTAIDPGFPPERWPEHWNTIMERGSMVFESIHKTKEGKLYPVEVSANYFEYNNQGYNLSLARNITERRHSEEKIKTLNQDLEKRVIERTSQLELANKELEAFAYSVSHDLRAPLRSIDGFSQVLLEEYYNSIDVQGKDYLTRVRKAAQRMGQLIDDMLSLSRVSRSEMSIQQVNFSEMAEEVARQLQESQPARKVKFIIQRGITVMGDSHLLHIVLDNLMGNAWKFTSKHDKALIEFGCHSKNGQMVYFVRDDGAGFSMDYAQKLFGAFQRLHTTHEFPGTGIGLATVQRIIHRHRGIIWAESKEEEGATFYFTIPNTN